MKLHSISLMLLLFTSIHLCAMENDYRKRIDWQNPDYHLMQQGILKEPSKKSQVFLTIKDGDFFLELERLLKENPELKNAQNNFEETALIYAVEQRRKLSIKTLLKYNPDVNAKSRFQKTALSTAVVQGDKDIVQLLLEKGAIVDKLSLIWAKSLADNTRAILELVQKKSQAKNHLNEE